MATETPTIVLVHGAWADATGFDAEIRALQDRGYSAIGFGNPLRDLAGDSAYLAEFLKTLSGPIVLVGHSYGGNVISMAAIGNEQVRALVYLNGWMCDEGESQQLLLEKFEGSLVGPSIRPVPFTNPDGSEGTDLYLAPEAFREAFAADVDPETAAVMAATQRPYAVAAFAGHAVGPAGMEHAAVLVPARYRGQGDPAGAPAVHGRARERDDRGGPGVARLVRVPARGRDPAHPAGRRGDSRRLTSASDDRSSRWRDERRARPPRLAAGTANPSRVRGLRVHKRSVPAAATFVSVAAMLTGVTRPSMLHALFTPSTGTSVCGLRWSVTFSTTSRPVSRCVHLRSTVSEVDNSRCASICSPSSSIFRLRGRKTSAPAMKRRGGGFSCGMVRSAAASLSGGHRVARRSRRRSESVFALTGLPPAACDRGTDTALRVRGE